MLRHYSPRIVIDMGLLFGKMKWYTPTILIVESWDYPGSKFDFRRTTLGWTSWHLNGEHENISNSIYIFLANL